MYHNVTVNSERFGHMTTDFCWPATEDYELYNMWFQPDDARSHKTT